jgi:hypothetical protein
MNAGIPPSPYVMPQFLAEYSVKGTFFVKDMCHVRYVINSLMAVGIRTFLNFIKTAVSIIGESRLLLVHHKANRVSNHEGAHG